MKKKTETKKYYLEVVSGVEGPCVLVGTDSGGTRVLGPKPWGGGNVIHRWELTKFGIENLLEELTAVKKAMGI